jgi:hypothetical protein
MLIGTFRSCACGLVAMAALAQQAPPDPAAVMGSLNQQMAPLASTWLHSADPRLQAWGAYAVLRDGRTEAIPDLLAMVAEFPVVEQPIAQTDVDQHDAMLGVLDALIQLNAQAPAADCAANLSGVPGSVADPAVALPGGDGARAAGHLQG